MMGAFIGNRYEIIEKIGEGGMAIVYKARCRLLNRNVAIKVLRPEFQNDAEFLKRFATEAQAAASLSHPNIVSIFDVGKHNDMHYIVMEYIEGVSFNEYIAKKGALPVFEALEYSMQIASALCHAHIKKIIHRDIKPHNIIMAEGGTLKVTDFGLARATSSSTVVAGGSAMGSVHYASPEQSRGGFTDDRSDLYSLGVMMYEMFTGKLPFDADTPIGVAMQHLQKTPVQPRSIKADIPEKVEYIILKAMEKDPRQRYLSAEEILKDLKMVSSGELDNTTTPYSNEKFKTKVLPTITDEENNKQELQIETEVNNKLPKKQSNKAHSGNNDKKSDALAVILAIITAIIIMSGIGIAAAKLLFSDGVQRAKVPALEGRVIDDVLKSIDTDEFSVEISEKVYSENETEGTIISQNPKRGAKVEIPCKITVVVSRGSGIFTVEDYRDKKYETVAEILNEKGINYEIVEEYDENVPEGNIFRQVPSAKTRMNADDTITLYVSLGPQIEKIEVPDITGLTENEATIKLYESGLAPGNIERVEDSAEKGTVIKQAVKKGTEVDEKTQVGFTVSLGKVEKVHSLKLTLPQDERESVNVRIMVNGINEYQKKHSLSEKTVTVNLKGNGPVQIDVYYDDVLYLSKTEEF